MASSVDDIHADDFVPITKPTLPPIEDYLPKLNNLWESGQITNGRLVRDVESRLEDFIGDTHCVAMSSCTSGLVLSLKALCLEGAVALPSFTFFATAHSVAWNGLEPVFVDVDERTWNLSPDSVRATLEIRPDISAILGVHVFGNPCQVEELEALAKKFGVKLVYDSAHALGASSNGRNVGAFGDVEVFSLSPTKPMVAAEGGIAATRHEDLAKALRCGRDYGNEGDYNPSFIGLNARLSELHAAMALGSLDMLEANIDRRNEIASHYKSNLGSIAGLEFQRIRENNRSTFKDLTVRIEQSEFGMSRDALSWYLNEEGIDTRKYYHPPTHRTKAYWKEYGKDRDEYLPVTNRLSKQVLSLPLWSHMGNGTVDRVCQAVLKAHDTAEDISQLYERTLTE
jgi:dTDP-4-amino-4,6-dideoxygalactose transaminase